MPRKKTTPSSKPRTPKTATGNRADVKPLLRKLKKTYPHVECALLHSNPYELLVATILSAQCTDERVNKVTPHLFAAYPSAKYLAQARLKDVEQVIHSLGFFRAKAKNLVAMAQELAANHQGEVPHELEALTDLPGVGRKTANVVLGVWFKKPTGVVVDTHVRRISRLLGLTAQNTPEKIEQDLIQLLPQKEWIDFSHRLISHGRAVCIARRPQCDVCPLLSLCPRVGLS